ncbi:transposase [Nitrosomonas sp.]|uniref:transposase n=1 Tax=Nitrosomonas sp. TaxID=42353 RepID=UPI003520BD50
MALTNTLERVPFRNADAFVAFTGFDPRANDSGNKIGRRRLSKRGPPSCVACCLTLQWPPPNPKLGSLSMRITAPKAGALPQHW